MIQKTRQEVLTDILNRLQLNTDINDVEPGQVARTFSDVLSEEFYDFYTALDAFSIQPFVSTATGRYLDLIGTLTQCTREDDESDDNYRARMIQQIYVIAGANQTSIRLQLLALDGISDVSMQQYSHGAGSFTAYIVADSQDNDLLDEAQSVIDNAKAYGIYGEAKYPDLIPLELGVRLIFSSDAGDAEKVTIRQTVISSVRSYFNTLQMGNTMILNEIINAIMNSSKKINDLEIYQLYVNGENRFIGNVIPKWNERLIIDTIDVI